MTPYRYNREGFNPTAPDPFGRVRGLEGGDRSTNAPYVYDEEIVLAVNVALATGRPLLVAGKPGAGKSSLAANVATQLGREYEEKVITTRTQAHELNWTFDAVRRFRDASAGVTKLDPKEYRQKGVLWTAFEHSQAGRQRVVLIDEIDKADPDLPNSLLDTLGAGHFRCDETDEEVFFDPKKPPLIIITTNDERELSRPFIRRCVALTLPQPNRDRFIAIANSWGLAEGADKALATAIADEVVRLNAEAATQDAPLPSSAEFLDALRTCLKLEITVGTPEWEAIKRATLSKRIGDTGHGT